MHKFQNRNAKVENTTYVVRAHITIYVFLLFFSFVSMSFEIPQLTILNPQKSYWISRLFFSHSFLPSWLPKWRELRGPFQMWMPPGSDWSFLPRMWVYFLCICQSWFLSTFKEFSRTTLVPGSSDKKRAFHFPLQTIRLLTKSLWWIG